MSFLSWNCRGLGNRRTGNALKKICKAKAPNIVFLIETKLNRDWMEKVHDQCESKHGLIVPSDGSIGGLAMLRKEGTIVHVKTYSMSHIDVFVDGGETTGWWHLTSFYEKPKTSLRFDS